MLSDASMENVISQSRRPRPRPRHRLRFGMALRRRRQVLGLSQEGLAEATGCHRNFVGNIERGEQNLSIDSMVKFARALKCGLADLFSDAGL